VSALPRLRLLRNKGLLMMQGLQKGVYFFSEPSCSSFRRLSLQPVTHPPGLGLKKPFSNGLGKTCRRKKYYRVLLTLPRRTLLVRRNFVK
jgi:hypothetical protein